MNKALNTRERQARRLEKQIEGLRSRLAIALTVGSRHQQIIDRMREGNREPSKRTIKARDKRQGEISELETKLAQKTQALEALRQEIMAISEFNPVMEDIEGLPEDFHLLGKGRWSLPNSRFKTYQDIFTPEEARVVPRARSVLRRREYDELSLEVCPVAPQRIPDWFVTEFGLADLEGLSGFKKLQKKVELRPELVALFQSAQPLSAGRHRPSYRALEVQNFSPEHDGKLIVAHSSGSRKHSKHRKVMQVFDSIYDAHRRTLYIDEGYDAEREKIQGIRARVRQCNAQLVGMKSSDPRRAQIEEQLASEAEILLHVTNKYKGESHDILEDVMEIRDRRGKHNPGATCARLVRVANLLEKRLPEIFDKGKYMLEDQKLLGARVEEGRAVMHENLHAYRQVCEILQSGNPPAARRRLTRMPRLDRLTVRPFNLYAAKLNEIRNAIGDGLQANDKSFVLEQAVNGYVLCKIFDVQHAREKVLRDIAKNPMETTIETLLGRALEIQGIVHAREVFPNVETSYAEPYEEISSKIDDLVRGLRHYHEQKMSDTERLAMYERLKAYLEGIDFPEILEKMR